jgi:HrpA-like RNA helicase
MERMGVPLLADPDTEELTGLRRALLKGLFHHAARRLSGSSGYRVYGSGQQVHLHPSSTLVASRPPCVVFSEVVLTSRPYAHTASVIEAAWLPELVPRFFAAQVQQ